jgi:hypothetical protein
LDATVVEKLAGSVVIFAARQGVETRRSVAILLNSKFDTCGKETDRSIFEVGVWGGLLKEP